MNRKGFTLIELVMVLVLIGIVAVFVAPRLGNVTSTKADAFHDKLMVDIRYAQNLAMTQNRRYRVYLNSNPPGPPAPAIPNPGYGVVYDTSALQNWSATAYAQDPAGNVSLSVALNAGDYVGITVGTPGNGAGGYVEFNSLGVPSGAVTNVQVYANGAPVGNAVIITSQTGAVN